MTSKGQGVRKNFPRNDISLEIFRGLNSDSSFDDFSQSRETEVLKEERGEFERRLRQSEQLRKQEVLVFSAKEKQVKQQVIALQGELKKLASSVKNLNQEVGKAIIETPVNPGIYHVSFLEKLISFVKLLTKQVEDASTWVTMHTARGKKKSYYWTQVGKSGSKFLLSQERYMATQAG